MTAINKEFLDSIGIDLDEEHYQAFAEHFDETLENRVITSMTDVLDDQQLESLAAMQNQDDTVIQAWLQANVPNLTEIIQDEVDILLGELAENSDKI